MSARSCALFRIAGALLLLAGPAWLQARPQAAPGDVLTLEQAVAEALSASRPVQMASLEVQKSRDRLLAAQTRRLPSLNVSLTGSEQLLNLDFFFRKGLFGTFPGSSTPLPENDTVVRTERTPTAIFSLSVAQPLTQLHRVNLGLEALRAGTEVAGQDLRFRRQEVIQGVRTAYHGVAQAQVALQWAEETVKLYREIERLTSDYLTQGVVLPADSLQVRAATAKAELDLQEATDTVAARREKLNLLMGRDVLGETRVEEIPPPAGGELDLPAARTRALEHRPDVEKLRLQIRQAEWDRKAKRAEAIPDVSLVLQWKRLIHFNQFIPKDFATLGIALEWEPFDWGRRHHELAEKDRNLEQIRLSLREVEASAIIAVNEASRRLHRARLAQEVARLARQAAAEEARVAAERYSREAVLLRDVLKAQTGLAEAGTRLQEAILAVWTATADFARATGDDQ